LPGVIYAIASTHRGTASLIATSQASRVSIDKTITALGYGLGRSAWLNRDHQVWARAALSFNVGLAFSPTDVSAIRRSAKPMMVLEALISPSLAALVVARAMPSSKG
jgi:hypothetical protein